MRCTRCDGLAVPQAVGIDADGRVVFGWCRDCLADTHCGIVEVAAKGLDDLKLTFTSPPRDAAGDQNPPRTQSVTVDQSNWLVGLVGFLMVAWGSTVVGAGILMGSDPGRIQSRLGNGSPPVLRVGGSATILLGLMFLTLAANRDRGFRGWLTKFVRWGGLALSLAVAIGTILSGAIYLNPLAVGWAISLPLILSSVAFLIDEHYKRRTPPVNPWEFPVVSYSEASRPERPKKRI